MIEYKDPIPPIIQFFDKYFEPKIYGNTFPSNPSLPSILVRSAGGTDYSRIQLIVRHETDHEAMGLCINAVNTIMSNFSEIEGLRVTWVDRESNPIPSVDADTNTPEAWCYLNVEHLEG